MNVCVCLCLIRRERSKVPYIVRQCIEEVEKRGIDEVGIYRISGVATDIQALKAAFDSSKPFRIPFPNTYQLLFRVQASALCAPRPRSYEPDDVPWFGRKRVRIGRAVRIARPCRFSVSPHLLRLWGFCKHV